MLLQIERKAELRAVQLSSCTCDRMEALKDLRLNENALVWFPYSVNLLQWLEDIKKKHVDLSWHILGITPLHWSSFQDPACRHNPERWAMTWIYIRMHRFYNASSDTLMSLSYSTWCQCNICKLAASADFSHVLHSWDAKDAPESSDFTKQLVSSNKSVTVLAASTHITTASSTSLSSHRQNMKP